MKWQTHVSLSWQTNTAALPAPHHSLSSSPFLRPDQLYHQSNRPSLSQRRPSTTPSPDGTCASRLSTKRQIHVAASAKHQPSSRAVHFQQQVVQFAAPSARAASLSHAWVGFLLSEVLDWCQSGGTQRQFVENSPSGDPTHHVLPRSQTRFFFGSHPSHCESGHCASCAWVVWGVDWAFR